MDNVNHPSHYNQGSIECIDAMIAAFGIDAVSDFCRCNAFKYIWRSPYKGKENEDMAKAIWYEDKFNELKKINKMNQAEIMKSKADSKNSLCTILEEIHKDINVAAEKGLYQLNIGVDYSHSFLNSVQCNYIATNPDFARVIKFKLENEGFKVKIIMSYCGDNNLLMKIKWNGN